MEYFWINLQHLKNQVEIMELIHYYVFIILTILIHYY